MSAQPAYHLRAERGGQAAPIDLPPARMTPAEIPLTLSADVLRLPYPPATRLVLAEIVSLYAATGLCDCSDTHFASRLTISRDTANRAVQQLEDDGVVLKMVDKSAGFYRTLTPLPAAISAKAQSNPYPQNAATYPQNAARGASRKMPEPYPQNAATPSRILPVDLAAKSDTNTPFNIPVNFQVNPTPSADASEAAPEKKTGLDSAPDLASLAEKSERPASHTRGAAGKTEEPAAFAAFWQAWPRREARADAVKAFAKLAPDDQAAAASRADAWLTARPDLAEPARHRFIPHATTWLNQARWTDDNPTATAAPHATANATSYPAGRPSAGAKPTSNATELAGALARRRFQQPAGGPGDSR